MRLRGKYWFAPLLLWMGLLAAESVRTVTARVVRIISPQKIVLRISNPRLIVGRHGDIYYDIIANGQPRRVIPAKVLVLDMIGADEVVAEVFEARGKVCPGYAVSFHVPAGETTPAPAETRVRPGTESGVESESGAAVKPKPVNRPEREVSVADPSPMPEASPPVSSKPVRESIDRMIYVPGGTVPIGIDERAARFWNEYPSHPVVIAPFYMDRHEVTCGRYARFLQETGHPPPPDWAGAQCPPGRENLPVTNVSWNDAAAFARWAGKRLPAESEWEYAGRGSSGWIYPWGNSFRAGATNSREAETDTVQPVGSRPEDRSLFGILDLAGNVSEWTGSPYRPYPGNSHPEKEYTSAQRVVRGGAYSVPGVYCRLVFRAHLSPDYRAGDLGFRCVVSAGAVRPAVEIRTEGKNKRD
jgi:formylglycine-generating enzyme required for sulfatase activity